MGIHSWQNIPLQFVDGLDSTLILPWRIAYLSNSSTYAWVLTKHALESSGLFPKIQRQQQQQQDTSAEWCTPKKRPLRYSLPQLPIWKISFVFFGCAAKTDKWSLWRTFPYTKLVFNCKHRIATLCYFTVLPSSIVGPNHVPCSYILIHSSHFHANRKRNTVNTYFYNHIQHLTRCLAFWFLKRTTVLSVPSDLEGHLSASWPSMKGWLVVTKGCAYDLLWSIF